MYFKELTTFFSSHNEIIYYLIFIYYSNILQILRDTSRLCRNYLVKKLGAKVPFLVDWPALSPDLIPIKMLWDEFPPKNVSVNALQGILHFLSFFYIALIRFIALTDFPFWGS